MGLKLGNTTIGSLYLGSTKISEAYLGSTKIFSSAAPVQYPYLLFQCDGYNGGHPTVSSTWSGGTAGGEYMWTQVSSSPNIWKLEITKWAVTSLGYGLPFLFSSNASPPVGTITSTCYLVGSGNMDVALNGDYCQSMDRMFAGCTGIKSIDPIHCTTVENVGGMFQGCINVEEGALDQYNWFNTYGVNISNHSGTFTDCGADTQTGAAELAQIPVGWGGTLVPASTALVTTRTTFKNNYDCWAVDTSYPDTLPDWSNMNGVYIFTQSSVSSYAGVSMNRSRIAKFNNLGTTQGTYALYFYPCFMQRIASGITWAVVTSGYNGMLAVGQGNTDMPGTLDYSTYGPFAYSFGTKDLPGIYTGIFFCFLVTNSPIDSSFDLSSTPYGVLYNSNFKTDAGLRWFS